MNIINPKSGALVDYTAMIGMSFQSRINLLSPIIKNNHYPTLGRYKERILIECIRNFLPKQFEVANGFVMFPIPQFAQNPSKNSRVFIAPEHQLSHQLDIVIFDSQNFPCVYRDDDFVILRPESVRAIVEVKGVLNHKELKSAITNFANYGKKLRRYFDALGDEFRSVRRKPYMMLMAWDVALYNTDKPVITPQTLRKNIIKYYISQVDVQDAGKIPFMEAALIYNNCEVQLDQQPVETIEQGNSLKVIKIQTGYKTLSGHFAADPDGTLPEIPRDRTIASLLSYIHNSLNIKHNAVFVPYDINSIYNVKSAIDSLVDVCFVADDSHLYWSPASY